MNEYEDESWITYGDLKDMPDGSLVRGGGLIFRKSNDYWHCAAVGGEMVISLDTLLHICGGLTYHLSELEILALSLELE